MKRILLLLLLLSLSYPFSIDSYENHAYVQGNGDLLIKENMSFTLEKEYNEGYRSIRPDDAGSLQGIIVKSVKVNGQPVPYTTQVYEGNYEIVWKKTYVSKNDVELEYTLKDRVELWSDFAKVCYEHFGANWDVAANNFEATMTMPEASRNKALHFEIYSAVKGTSRIDDLTVVTEIPHVPSGNYVGGCYLFARDSVTTSKTVNDSAYDKLQEERELYGSESILEPDLPFDCCLIPIALILAITAVYEYRKQKKYPVYPDSILPPGKEEPAVVAALLRNSASQKNLLTATLLSLINRKNIDIIELEKEKEGATISRERTILLLKNRKGLKKHEEPLVDMIFANSEKVDLDKLMEDYEAVSAKKAKEHPVTVNLKKFREEIEELLKDRGVWKSIVTRNNRLLALVIVAVIGFFMLLMLVAPLMGLFWQILFVYLPQSDFLRIMFIGLEFLVITASLYAIAKAYFALEIPDAYSEKYARWRAFENALKSSRIKEYPPSSVEIWGEILVYATALGMADKVKKHLSELDVKIVEEIEKLDRVRVRTNSYYASAVAVSALRVRRSGGFSGGSSGGWSSGGGGGFSGGHSGGGGFR